MGSTIVPKTPHEVMWAGNYLWRNLDGSGPNRLGVALLIDRRVVHHLTPQQALKLADQIVDVAEAVIRGDRPINYPGTGNK